MTPHKLFGFGPKVYFGMWGLAVGALASIPIGALLFAVTGTVPWISVVFSVGAWGLCGVGEVWARRRYVSHPPDLELVGHHVIMRIRGNEYMFDDRWTDGWVAVDRHTRVARRFAERADALAHATTHYTPNPLAKVGAN